jgi:hypothetical protein
MDTADASLTAATRRMWQAIKPIQMSVYFAPEPADDAQRIGLRGYWMGYFAVLAAVAVGLRGIEAALTHTATGAITLDTLQRSRGWDTAQLNAAASSLTARGLLDGKGRLTGKGRALRRGIEHTTDRLASAPATHLGEDLVRRVIDLAAPLSRQLIDSGLVPVPNPDGAPRP